MKTIPWPDYERRAWRVFAWVVGVLLALNVANQMRHLASAYDACEYRALNHEGVEECHVGPYRGPLPTDTTGGGDIEL